MDGLALLCNLHADGPTTLHHLRAGGCGSLLEVATKKPAELESLLGWNAKAARRFQREARILAARLENGQSDGAWIRAFAEDPKSPPLDGEPSPPADVEEEESGDPPVESRSALDPARSDEEAALLPAATAAESAATVETLQSLVGTPDCESLTLDIVDKLERAGVRTLMDLVDGDVLEISSLIGIGYTRLARLRFLVRRHLDARETEVGGGVEVIPSPPPAAPDATGDRLGASGPFA